MKLVDPLSVMQFLGGSLPIHLSMLFYAANMLFVVKPKVSCWKGYQNNTIKTLFNDVWIMFAAHIVSIVAQVLKTCCRNTDNSGAQWRTFLKFIYVFFYLFALVFVIMAEGQQYFVVSK